MSNDEWSTPGWLYDRLDEVFRFTLDAAASDDNHRAPAWYTPYDDGLARPWPGRVFVNPPYSRPAPWVERAWRAARDGEAELVVMLLPVDTSTHWFRGVWRWARQILFLGGRLAYDAPPRPSEAVLQSQRAARGIMGTAGRHQERRRRSARFSSCLALFGGPPEPTAPGLTALIDLGHVVRQPSSVRAAPGPA